MESLSVGHGKEKRKRVNGHGWMTHGVVSGPDCVVIVTW